MANSPPLSDFFGTYTHQLTASDLPQMSHNYYVNSSKVKSLNSSAFIGSSWVRIFNELCPLPQSEMKCLIWKKWVF